MTQTLSPKLISLSASLVLSLATAIQCAAMNQQNNGQELHAACIQGDTDSVLMLIAQGADVNAKDNDNRTPLHRACFGGHTECAQLLIASGADVNARNTSGQTPLGIAQTNNQTELVNTINAVQADIQSSTHQ